MGDLIHRPVAANPVHNGWVTAYTDKLGNSKILAPSPNRPATHPNGPLPTIPSASGLRGRFDDPTYY